MRVVRIRILTIPPYPTPVDRSCSLGAELVNILLRPSPLKSEKNPYPPTSLLSHFGVASVYPVLSPSGRLSPPEEQDDDTGICAGE